MLLLVTGLPSPGKERFVDALSRRVGAGHMVVGWFHGAHPESVLLHVHAESDAEALIEGGSAEREADARADLVVRVDWEPVDASIDRVLQTLRTRVAEMEG